MFHLKILTAEAIYFDGFAHSVIAPGALGYLEILKDHAPLISVLIKGHLTIKDEKKTIHTYLLTGGVLEVHANEVSLLADTIESVS